MLCLSTLALYQSVLYVSVAHITVQSAVFHTSLYTVHQTHIYGKTSVHNGVLQLLQGVVHTLSLALLAITHFGYVWCQQFTSFLLCL
jgi:hypothetical protein